MKTSKQWKTTLTKNGRRPQQKMEDDQKNGRWPKKENRRRPQAQLKRSTLIGSDIIVN